MPEDIFRVMTHTLDTELRQIPYFSLHKTHFFPQIEGEKVCASYGVNTVKKGFSHHHPEASHCHAGRPLNWHQRLAVWTSPFCTASFPGSASCSLPGKPARPIAVGNENRKGPKGKKVILEKPGETTNTVPHLGS